VAELAGLDKETRSVKLFLTYQLSPPPPLVAHLSGGVQIIPCIVTESRASSPFRCISMLQPKSKVGRPIRVAYVTRLQSSSSHFSSSSQFVRENRSQIGDDFLEL
jgi:hypothetical protein